MGWRAGPCVGEAAALAASKDLRRAGRAPPGYAGLAGQRLQEEGQGRGTEAPASSLAPSSSPSPPPPLRLPSAGARAYLPCFFAPFSPFPAVRLEGWFERAWRGGKSGQIRMTKGLEGKGWKKS